MSRADSMHTEWDELAAGYAVHALEPDDESQFVAHLRGCDRCTETVADLTDVAATLAHATPVTRTPRSLDRRIAQIADSASEHPVSLREPFWTRRWRIVGAAVAAAAAGAVAVGIGVSQSGGSGSLQVAELSCRHSAGCSVIALQSADGRVPV